jgi:hypothetical protein
MTLDAHELKIAAGFGASESPTKLEARRKPETLNCALQLS